MNVGFTIGNAHRFVAKVAEGSGMFFKPRYTRYIACVQNEQGYLCWVLYAVLITFIAMMAEISQMVSRYPESRKQPCCSGCTDVPTTAVHRLPHLHEGRVSIVSAAPTITTLPTRVLHP